MARTPAKLIKYFHEHIRRDEDECWIWQGHVNNGVPIITINDVATDARLFGAEIYGIKVPKDFETCSALDVNPKHIRAKKPHADKYRKVDYEGMGKLESRRNSTDSGNGISQSQE
jgi:hypothetical protein